MTIVAVISTPEKNGNTEAVVNKIAESAKANGLDPQQYLWEILENLPSAKNEGDYNALMPWKKQ